MAVDPRLVILAERTDAGVAQLDEEGRGQWLSPRACRLLGCREGEDPGTCLQPLRAQLDEALAELVSRDPAEPAATERELALEAGREPGRPARELHLELHRVDDSASTGYLLLLRDLVAERRQDVDLHHAGRLRNLTGVSRALGHDLRTPAATSLLYLQLLRDSLKSAGQDEAVQHLQIIEEGVRALDDSMRLLLTQLRPEGDEPEQTDLVELATQAHQLIAPAAREQMVEAKLNLPDEPAEVFGWPHRLRQAMLAMLVNALEAMPEGGVLELSVEKQPGTATVTVCDSGPGVPESARQHIFDRYYTTRGDHSGTGLTIAREVAEAQGGSLEVGAGRLSGACFILRLPLAGK